MNFYQNSKQVFEILCIRLLFHFANIIENDNKTQYQTRIRI